MSAEEITRVADFLTDQLPIALSPEAIPRQRGAVIGVPVRPEPLPVDPGAEPDALFDVSALAARLAEQVITAAAASLVEWMGFLHPAQTRLVRRSYAGPARIRGPAGTGKSVVMLHRTAWLAEPDAAASWSPPMCAPCPSTRRPFTSACPHHRGTCRLPRVARRRRQASRRGRATDERQRPPRRHRLRHRLGPGRRHRPAGRDRPQQARNLLMDLDDTNQRFRFLIREIPRLLSRDAQRLLVGGRKKTDVG